MLLNNCRQSNIAYVTYNELLWHPLLKRQAIELLYAIKARFVSSFYIISFIPLVYYIRFRLNISEIKRELKSKEIHPIVIPSFAPFPFPYLLPIYKKGQGWKIILKVSMISTPFVILNTLPVLVAVYIFFRVRIFHFRSYPATLSAPVCKLFLPNFRFVFDPRSDFPEENITAGNWRSKSLSFAFWKMAERIIIKRADSIICISDSQIMNYKKSIDSKKYVLIPNNVDTDRFSTGYVGFRQKYREKTGIDNKLVFCYSGTITFNSWHNPDIYAKAIKSFRVLKKPHLFLFLISQYSNATLSKAFAESGVRENEYIICNPKYDEVPMYLAIADYGIMFLEKKKVSLGTKLVEYLATGLPVIVNSNVGGAISMLEKNQMGLVIDIGLGDMDRRIDTDKILMLDNIYFSHGKIRDFCYLYFSNDTISNKYIEIYLNLMRCSF